MSVASLVLGIISAVVSFIPFCGTWAIVPAIVGLVLGIIDWTKKKKANEPKGKAIAGTICSGVAILIILVWWIVALFAANKVSKTLETTDWNEAISDWNETLSSWNYSVDE